MSGNVFFSCIPAIVNVLFPFLVSMPDLTDLHSHSFHPYSLFTFSPALIPILLVVSHQITNYQ